MLVLVLAGQRRLDAHHLGGGAQAHGRDPGAAQPRRRRHHPGQGRHGYRLLWGTVYLFFIVSCVTLFYVQ